jgi:Phage capsid protein
MSASIDQAFVKQYQAEVQEAYQRQGSKLRPTVRSKSEVRGASTIFQKVGLGTAAAKAQRLRAGDEHRTHRRRVLPAGLLRR